MTLYSDVRLTCSRTMTHHLNSRLRALSARAFCAISLLGTGIAAAQGEREMGTGIPHFGSYSAATGVQTLVWGLNEATVPFPADCTRLYLTAATMGMDAYKIAVATLLVARTTHRAVRFYAHAPRDGGCGVDYVQLN